MPLVGIEAIRAAQGLIAGQVHRTPVFSSRSLSEATGLDIVLKAENLQKTGSFKPRGALVHLAHLSEAEKRPGVITVSAGNHAQGLAYAARVHGIACTVVMPAAANPRKAQAARAYGAEVVQFGNISEIFDHCRRIQEQRGLTFVHPFDHPDIIAGQGTVGLELVEQAPDLDAVVVPIGGGGLIAGIAAAVRALSPKAKVYGVEPEGAAAMRRSLDAGKPVHLEKTETMADGLAAPFAGENTFEHVRDLVQDVVLVTETAIAEALLFILERAKLVVEPAGAAGVAALLSKALPLAPGNRVAVVLSGGNLDPARLRQLLA
ncbi:MAG TPA: threonine/serine dehydratase [Acidobacteriota bacterium]